MLRLYSPFYAKKNCWTGILILGPVFGLWPQIAHNGPILENRTSPSVFELGFSNAQYILTLPCPEMLLDQNFDLAPHLGPWRTPKWSKFHFFVRGHRGFKFSECIQVSCIKVSMQYFWV